MLKPDTEFINFLKDVGSDFSLTQGLGGNGSMKSHGSMLVKASGMRLGNAESPGYFHEVEVAEGLYREAPSRQPGKPSIEVFLHALLPQQFVVHLHSTKGVALSMLAGNSSNLRAALLAQGIPLIEYHKPGIELRDAVNSSISQDAEDSEPKTFLLQNHGTLFGANSVDELKRAVELFEDQASKRLGSGFNLDIHPQNLKEVLDGGVIDHIKWHALNTWRISPDHVVFLGAEAPSQAFQSITSPSTILEVVRTVLPDSVTIGVREEQLLWFINVIQFLPKVQLPTLTKGDANQLVSWDAEKHRLDSSETLN
jgi:ribulose-5-phosphate 4-epimerase/fuculose-1-phosphate aldolase